MISKDWQLIPRERVLIDNCYFLTQESVERLANEMAWEVVCIGDYMETIHLYDQDIDASNIYAIRPPTIDVNGEYNNVILPCCENRYGSGNPFTTISLTTGEIINSLLEMAEQMYTTHLLRTSSNGAICLDYMANSSSYGYFVIFDNFYNPKTEETHWGAIYNNSNDYSFVDLHTGLKLTNLIIYSPYCDALFRNESLVMLKKLTVINTNGVFNATTLFQYLIDYSNMEKLIDIDGEEYINIRGKLFYVKA